MTRKQNDEAKQLTFDALDQLDEKLEEEPGKLYKLEIKPEDIGGELLSVLSKGLYTNPLDCIREYVQNAVDARSNNVTIKITGNSVIVVDDGRGMNLPELVQSRQFGLSGKSIKDNVGFRGIGIYSGFDLCNRLRITTKKKDEGHINILLFDFEGMRARLDADKRAETETRKTSLFDLLTNYTQIGREVLPTGSVLDRHFTMIQLENISDVHIRELSNRDKLRTYLLQNLPIDFSDEFEYKDLLNELLNTSVEGYSAIKITLQSDGRADEVVVKDAIPNLQPPTYGFIQTSAGQSVAYYWACLNKNRDRINKNLDAKDKKQDQDKSNQEERTSFEGFVYKVKGFTIGDRQKLRTMFESKAQLYPWYTGEIFVLDTNVVPNAERNDFETNQAKRSLTFAVSEKLKELEALAEVFQAKGVAHERITKYQKEISDFNDQVEANTQDDEYKLYSRLDVILKDLTRQKGQADTDNKKLASTLIEQARSLQQRLRKEVDNPKPEADRKNKAAKSQKVKERDPVPQFVPVAVPSGKTLTEVLSDAGWILEGDLARLVNAVQSSLEEAFARTSPTYRSLINDIELKITGNSNDAEF